MVSTLTIGYEGRCRNLNAASADHGPARRSAYPAAGGVGADRDLLGRSRRLATPAAIALGLNSAQTSIWILSLSGIPGLASIILTLVYRQPLLVAWHTGVVAFVASLGRDMPYPELLGGTMVAGFAVAALGALALTTRVATLVPTPIIFGVVAGNVLPFVVGTFNALDNEVLLVGEALLAYLLGRRLLIPRLPAILPTLLVSIALASATRRMPFPTAGCGHTSPQRCRRSRRPRY